MAKKKRRWEKNQDVDKIGFAKKNQAKRGKKIHLNIHLFSLCSFDSGESGETLPWWAAAAAGMKVSKGS